MFRGFIGLSVLFGLTASIANAETLLESRRVQRRVRIASNALVGVMGSANAVPPYVLAQARCIASVRSVKAGFIFGGEGSVGLVSCRVGDDWSLPSFLNIGGPNVGLQIGVQTSEVVLVFMTDRAKQILWTASFNLGVDASVAAGPVGGGNGAGFTPNAHVLAYAQTRGLYAGLKLDALVLSHGPRGNAEAYGDNARPAEILATPSLKYERETIGRFPQLLRQYTTFPKP